MEQKGSFVNQQLPILGVTQGGHGFAPPSKEGGKRDPTHEHEKRGSMKRKIKQVGFVPAPESTELREVWENPTFVAPFIGWEQTVFRYEDGEEEIVYTPLVVVDECYLISLHEAEKGGYEVKITVP